MPGAFVQHLIPDSGDLVPHNQGYPVRPFEAIQGDPPRGRFESHRFKPVAGQTTHRLERVGEVAPRYSLFGSEGGLTQFGSGWTAGDAGQDPAKAACETVRSPNTNAGLSPHAAIFSRNQWVT